MNIIDINNTHTHEEEYLIKEEDVVIIVSLNINDLRKEK